VKGDRLGEFEEFTLLAVRALGEPTYGVPVQQFVERAAKRAVSLGAVYAALDRLEAKGFLRSILGASSPTRGGKRKRLFDVTPLGIRTLKDLRQTRERIWHAIEIAAGRRS
jgi:PadR family transcriptional regulator